MSENIPEIFSVGNSDFIALEGGAVNVAHIESVEWRVDERAAFTYQDREYKFGIGSKTNTEDLNFFATIPAEALPGEVRITFGVMHFEAGESTQHYSSCTAECPDGLFLIKRFRLQRPVNPYAYRLGMNKEPMFGETVIKNTPF